MDSLKSISCFSRLPQAVYKEQTNRFSHKVSSSSMKIDPVINGFIPNKVKGHLYIYHHPIINLGIRGLCLGFSNTSQVDILDRF